MAVIRVTKQFKFEMSHVLWNYDGPCKNIHGHSYTLYVTVKGEPRQKTDSPKYGMVVDFGDLKKIVSDAVINIADHSVYIGDNAPAETLSTLKSMFERCEIVNFQPTCENLVVHFAEKIRKKLPSYISLFSLRLDETATSYAEWYAGDNL